MGRLQRAGVAVCWILLLSTSHLGRQLADLSGQVLDQTGAVIVGARVVLADGQGDQRTAMTGSVGQFRFRHVAVGTYRLTVTAPGFAPYVNPNLHLDDRQAESLSITLTVVINEELDIEERSGISVLPGENISAIVLKGVDLESLPDDPDELMEVLRQLAGPTAGMGDAQVYVDGFEQQGELPPKESIREIRINNNPFSAQYSQPGFGRIEILTRPGTDSFQGRGTFNFNDESLNARNAFAPTRAPLQVRRFGGSLSGPLVRRGASFFVTLDRRELDENAVTRATILDPVTLEPTAFATTELTPQRRTRFRVRNDVQLTQNNTMTVIYSLSDSHSDNQGLGEFNLPEHAYQSRGRQHELRLSLSTILGNRLVNEARLRVSRQSSLTRAISDEPQLIVLDAFTGGGAQSSLFNTQLTDRFDLVDYVSLTLGRHAVKFGTRIEVGRLQDIDRSNFGGTYTFSSLEQYRDVLNQVPGVRPAQLSFNVGEPLTGLTQVELSWFLQDDWRVRPNLTLSFGLRHEFQTHLDDRLNFAPRLGFAWSPGTSRTTALRGGFGLFFDRLQETLVLNVSRFSREQQQFIILNPTFCNPIILDPGNQAFCDPRVDSGRGAGRSRTQRLFSSSLNAPYAMQASMSLERQLPLGFVASATYSWIRGVHQFRSRNLNAPLPGSGERPFPNQGPMLAIEAVANSARHELRINVQRRLGRRFSLFGNYVLSSTRSDGDGVFSLPANQFNLRAEWGRASIDSRHQFFLGSFMRLPWNVRLAPFVTLRSGRPFNITTGEDNNNDTAFTDRPAQVDPSTQGALVTRLGAFALHPGPGVPLIIRNFGHGPGFASLNLYFTKTIGFGNPRRLPGARSTGQSRPSGRDHDPDRAGKTPLPAPKDQLPQSSRGGRSAGPGRLGRVGGRGRPGQPGRGRGRFGARNEYRYSVTLGLRARNLLNRLNPGRFSGVLTSPFFGRANSALPARRIELQLRVNF